MSDTDSTQILPGLSLHPPAGLIGNAAGGESAIPRQFRLDDNFIYYAESNGDNGGEQRWVRVCSRLDLEAHTRNAAGNNWGKLLKWRDHEGRVHRWAMPMHLLSRQGVGPIPVLLSGGLTIESDARLLEYVKKASPTRVITCTERTGWHGHSYVLPDKTIGLEGAGEIVYQSATEAESINTLKGTLEEWRLQVGRYCRGNSRLLLAASTVLAGPVLRLTGDESGGIHLFGPTSCGKSTAA